MKGDLSLNSRVSILIWLSMSELPLVVKVIGTKELGVFLLMKGMYYYFSRKRNTGVGQQEERKMESLLNYVYIDVLQFSRYEY